MDREEANPAILAVLPNDDDVIAGNSFTGNQLRLRMSAVNVTNALYTINNGNAVSYAHDDTITVSANYNDPITVTLMGRAAGGNWIAREFTYTRVEPEEVAAPPVEEPTHVNVYFSINRNANFQAWGGHTSGVRTYTFNPELFGGWPGGAMTRMKYNGADTHWYKIEMPRAAVGGIIFNTQSNSGTGQQTNQPAITASMLNNEQLYFYGTGATGFNINGSSDSGANARANWDTAFAAGNNIGFEASGVFPPGRNGVIFNTSGGSSVANQYVREGEKAIRPATDPTRSGYLFDGKWYTDPAFTQEYDFDTPVVNTLGDDHIYALTLYAGWIELEADKFLVEFNSHGGSPVMSIPNVVGGTKITAPEPPVRIGYTFGGWFKDSAYNNAWNFDSDTVTAATTLFAKWEIEAYTITYRDGEVSAVMPGNEPAAYTVETATFNLSDPSPKDGYTFDGWFTDPQFRPSSKLTSVEVNSVGHLTLYARFTANTYRITLDPQSGSGGTESVSVKHGGKLPLGITPPVKTGYSFQGYFANTGGTGQQYYNSGGVRVFEGSWSTAPVGSFYAHWIPTGGNPDNPGPTNPPSNPGPSTPAPTGVIKDGDKAIVELGSGITSKTIPVQDIGGLSLQVKAANAVLTVQADALKQWLTQAGNPSGASIEVAVAPVTARDIANAPVEGGQARVEIAGVIYDFTVKLKHDNQVIDISHVGGGVEISLPYNNEADEDLLGVYYFNEETKAWEYVGGSVDAAKNTVTVTLEHLSKYAVLEYTKSFTDVPSNHWAARTLEVLAAKHIINGTSDSLFTPNGHTTRAEFTSLVVRALGLSKAARSAPFDDVQSGQWCANEVAIAYEAGLVSGVSGNKFDPNATITREQMAVLLVRAYEYKNSTIAATGQETAGLEDGSSISSWAVDGVNKAFAAGLLQGKGNGIFDPASDANRAEAAQAIYTLLTR